MAGAIRSVGFRPKADTQHGNMRGKLDTANWRIRRATHSDLERIIGIDLFAQSYAERLECLNFALISGEGIVADAQGSIAGFIQVNNSFFGYGFIPLILVSPDCRRSGVGLGLIAEAVRRCTSTKLFTSANTSNEPATRLLEKAGFRKSGQIDNLDDHDPEIIYIFRGELTRDEGSELAVS